MSLSQAQMRAEQNKVSCREARAAPHRTCVLPSARSNSECPKKLAGSNMTGPSRVAPALPHAPLPLST
eukprot:490097-Rhodomonas_salina.7